MKNIDTKVIKMDSNQDVVESIIGKAERPTEEELKTKTLVPGEYSE